jgi:hypothetical protein
VVHVPRQFRPQSGGVRRAEVDLEIGAVKTDLDVLATSPVQLVEVGDEETFR